MTNYVIGIKGSTPFLMHHYAPGMASTKKKTEKALDGSIDYSGEWRATVYTSMSDKTKIVLPDYVVQAALREAGAKIKSGRGSMKSSAVTDVYLDNTEFPITVDGKEFTVQDIEDKEYLFKMGVRIERKTIDRIRAFAPQGWKSKITITSDLPKDVLEQLFETAGRRCGFGDWRPNSPKPGGYGRFEVESIKEA